MRVLGGFEERHLYLRGLIPSLKMPSASVRYTRPKKNRRPDQISDIQDAAVGFQRHYLFQRCAVTLYYRFGGFNVLRNVLRLFDSGALFFDRLFFQ